MFKKTVVVDCKGHLMGRLASIVAKELLSGQKVVCVRCEEINVSGSLYRNKLKYQRFLRLRTNTNPRHGPFHLRSPSKMFARVVRGMIPHKTKRGAAALANLKTFEGVPSPYDKVKKQVVPTALRFLKLKPGRRFCRLGDVLTKVGWNYDGLVKKLEDRRKERSHEHFKAKCELKAKELKAASKAFSSLSAESKAVLTQLSL
ncbi:60S ribosomal protein L13, putative [Theileria equi strain WA]|uniref:60S ribosomal protein L13, putative n=1 Tax=Theileria equi strain WA TaxID=1537102 RepID=L0B0Z0_THEEQ|nr:60S ribosomal protein L13, putative [Theileria equi strain WA]AFZ81183.1 60S ribosomal protein L13, putative [Theileria equi strain WA]|eukprot:XP_004830849.1 60S ribosomal protein L13, putative [Theileria equi strain WA]